MYVHVNVKGPFKFRDLGRNNILELPNEGVEMQLCNYEWNNYLRVFKHHKEQSQRRP